MFSFAAGLWLSCIAEYPAAVWVYLICPLYTDTLVRGVRGGYAGYSGYIQWCCDNEG